MKAIKFLLFGIALLLAGIFVAIIQKVDSVPLMVIACVCAVCGLCICIFGLKTSIYKDAEFNSHRPPQDNDNNHKGENK